MQRFRYRSGVVGESDRAVHIPTGLDGDDEVASLCSRNFRFGDVEAVDAFAGMPCMACVLVAAQLDQANQSDVVTGSNLHREVGGGDA